MFDQQRSHVAVAAQDLKHSRSVRLTRPLPSHAGKVRGAELDLAENAVDYVPYHLTPIAEMPIQRCRSRLQPLRERPHCQRVSALVVHNLERRVDDPSQR
jgi:hypothetical protein